MVIFRTFRFEAAHSLTRVPEGHKCRRLHGHSYRFVVHLRGNVDPATGWVMDFAELKKVVGPLVDELDHHNLNDIPAIGETTAENLAKYLWRRLRPLLPGLEKIELWETENAGCIYAGEEE